MFIQLILVDSNLTALIDIDSITMMINEDGQTRLYEDLDVHSGLLVNESIQEICHKMDEEMKRIIRFEANALRGK